MKKKVAFIESSYSNTKDKGYSGVGYYRIIKPAQYLQNEFDVTVYDKNIKKLGKSNEELYGNLFKKHDIVITKAVDSPRVCSALTFFAQHYKKPLLVDLDDNYFTVRPDQPAYKWYYPGSQKRAIFASYLSGVDGIICSTKPLADFYKKFLKERFKIDVPTYVAPNFNDIKDFNYKPKRKKKNKIVIGWQGSTTHMADLKMVLPAIVNVMKEHKNVEFDILGALEMEQASEVFTEFGLDKKEVGNRIFVGGGTKSWEGYPKLLSQQPWDIGIAPLINDEFNKGKSHIKWQEYAMYKIPCIASKVYPYYKPVNGTKVIRHNKSGFLARNTKEWEKYLHKLIKSDIIRKEIGEQAYYDVKERWQPQHHISQWVEIINKHL